MITLTKNAVTQIQKIYTESAEGDKHLRILVGAGGCSGFEYGMAFDDKKDKDHKIQTIEIDEGRSFECIIDETSLEYMRGSVIDFDGGLSGKGFEIRNPNATSSCGCGRSFN